MATDVAQARHTLNVVDPELLYESGREDTGRKGTTENLAEFGIKASNTHILELEVWCQNRVVACPAKW